MMTRCGVTLGSLAQGKSKRRRVLGCHRSYCPACARLRRNRIFSRMRPWVEGQMGLTGGAAFLTLSLPESDGRVIDRLARLSKEVRSIPTARDWRRGFCPDIGVVMTFEIGPGSNRTGYVHAHLFIYSGSREALGAFLNWLSSRWSRRVKRDLIEGAGLEFMGPNPEEWAPRLHYLLKGNRIALDWPLPLVEEVLEAITSGKRFFSVWGLAKRRGGWTRARFAGNIQAFRPSLMGKLKVAG